MFFIRSLFYGHFREQINKYDNKFQNYLFEEFKRLFIIEHICKYMIGLSNRQRENLMNAESIR